MFMKVVKGWENLNAPLAKSVLSIGNFDGFHRGHQQVLAQAAMLAENERASLVVLTFEPHPLAILRPDHAPARLCTPAEKMQLIGSSGAALAIVLESTRELLSMEPEAFVGSILKYLRPIHVVEGSSFRFGRNRTGTPELLQSLGDKCGFRTCIIQPVTLSINDDESIPVSSSAIRRLIVEGRVHRAALCLGRRYTVTGRVGRGAGRGATLGFPTANLDHVQQLVPGDGVYAGFGRIRERRFPSAISIGVNPTFQGTQRKFEAHLLDCEVNLSNLEIGVEFGRRLRDQRTFPNADELRAQIARDVAAVREYARNATPTASTDHPS